MIASRSTLYSPRSRSTVSTVSRSRPEKRTGCDTARQPTSARRKVRPLMRLRIVERGTTVAGAAAGSGCGSSGGEDRTRRAVPPVSRPLTYAPATVSVRATRMRAGSLTSTSVSCTCWPRAGRGMRAAAGASAGDGRGWRRRGRRRADHEHPVPAHEELRRGSLQRQRAPERGRVTRHVDGVQRAVGQREQPAAVGLDEVGLVDAGLLHVRRRLAEAPLSAEAGGGPVAATGPASPAAPCGAGTGMRASGTGGGRPTRVGTPMLPRVRRSALRA